MQFYAIIPWDISFTVWLAPWHRCGTGRRWVYQGRVFRWQSGPFFRLSYEGITITLDGYHPFLANDNDENYNDIYIYMCIYIHTQMHAQIIHTLDLQGYIHIYIYTYIPNSNNPYFGSSRIYTYIYTYPNACPNNPYFGSWGIYTYIYMIIWLYDYMIIYDYIYIYLQKI